MICRKTMLPFCALALIAAVGLSAGAAGGEAAAEASREGAREASPAPSWLFGSEDGPVFEAAAGLWLTHGFSQSTTESYDSGKLWQNANLMATADIELRLPGHHWLGLWGRGGTTVYNHQRNSDLADDGDSDAAMAELNLVLTLAGRGSPIIEDDDLPRTSLDLFAGARWFREEYEGEIAGGVQREMETSWVGPQIGLRGSWCLQDTYNLDSLEGWSLTLRGAVMPWMEMEATDRRDGAKAFELESSRGYGGSAAAGVEWSRGPVALTVGFEALFLRADSGDEEDSAGVVRDIETVRTTRYGAFMTLALRF
ncbi:MAG TPA: hypothetical protein PK280_10805 [Planctomycetota bacterium]|nr:hypothetical protein [Planctomycetota bacterium]